MSFVSMVASASGCVVGKVNFCAHVTFDRQLYHVFDLRVRIFRIELDTEVLDKCRTKFCIFCTEVDLQELIWQELTAYHPDAKTKFEARRAGGEMQIDTIVKQ